VAFKGYGGSFEKPLSFESSSPGVLAVPRGSWWADAALYIPTRKMNLQIPILTCRETGKCSLMTSREA
jgi:hypothetical protein